MDDMGVGVIGEPVIGTLNVFKPGPGDTGYNVGSVMRRASSDYPCFVKENSPNGEVWRRIDSAEDSGETRQGEK